MEISDELDRNVYVCLMVTFTMATLSVIGYMLVGSSIFVYGALGVYAFSFSLLALCSIRKLFQVAHYKDRLNRAEKSLMEAGEDLSDFRREKEGILKVTSSVKRKEIVKAILSGAFALFTIVVLVLF